MGGVLLLCRDAAGADEGKYQFLDYESSKVLKKLFSIFFNLSIFCHLNRLKK